MFTYPVRIKVKFCLTSTTVTIFYTYEHQMLWQNNTYAKAYQSIRCSPLRQVATQYVNAQMIAGFIAIFLSHDVASGSDITSCNKIDKPLVAYRFRMRFFSVMTSIITLRKIWQNLDIFTPKNAFLITFIVM